MSQSNLIELTYYDPEACVRLTTYADTIITDRNAEGNIICAIRFGGYPEEVRAMSDVIYGGANIDAIQNGKTHHLKSALKRYRRQLSHDGIYSTATLMMIDDAQSNDFPEDEDADAEPRAAVPRKCYVFCPAGDRDLLFEELDRKTAAPLIPAFRDYALKQLINRGELRKLEVFSLTERMDAWVLTLLPDDANVVEVLERGLASGEISIPGADPSQPDGFAGVKDVTGYLNAFGVTVADRIRNQFQPLFDPASEPLSEEVLAINGCIRQNTGYSLYDAQLAVAEAVKRQLDRKSIALIVAECGSGKTKIGATALGALHGLLASQRARGESKTFNIILSPSHVMRKWVREIGETLPNTYAMVVRSITDLDRLYALYEAGDKNVFAVLSKERARDGYMRYPAVTWSQRRRAFLCPDCLEPIQMTFSEDGTKYMVYADQFFFQHEHRKNHTCPNCGCVLWAPVSERREIEWIKIGGYGWVHRYDAAEHLERTENASVVEQLENIRRDPDGFYPTKGAHRRFSLSTYIKRKMRGKISGFICDELHEYNNNSGQGDAMAELFGASKQFVGMTATLINGYSSGIFHLLYRVVPGLMRKDGRSFRRPSDFDAEYGVVENVYEIKDGNYNSNRRTTKRRTKAKQLPGVSPLVYSRFLLEYTAFLSLSDLGKELPDYEEIPVPLEMPPKVCEAYKSAERVLQNVLKGDRYAARKLLSTYLNLLTVYPDQPYDQPEIIHPLGGRVLVKPEDTACFEDVLPKDETALKIVRAKVAAGGRVLIYTSWTRTDSQKKLLELLNREGIHTEILTPAVRPEKREEWLEKKVSSGLQVLITNPKCVETGLDLIAFTTLIFYSIDYNLFTFRQASRRSWRINQTAPRVEVYLLYYMDTMQAKAIKLMASKLAVAGIIEGSFSEEGLAAMSDVKDLMSQMAKELAQGIKDNVEDIAAAFKKMAIINPDRNRSQAEPVQAIELAAAETAPAAPDLRTADAAGKQAVYEGLLQRTLEEQKKRRPRRVEIENQISLFGPAA